MSTWEHQTFEKILEELYAGRIGACLSGTAVVNQATGVLALWASILPPSAIVACALRLQKLYSLQHARKVRVGLQVSDANAQLASSRRNDRAWRITTVKTVAL